ncbi:MAG TPA: response regulator transcription factor [Polyangia bacterium]|nr:response regulator transcription factor [Polyangia bacterium]
MGDLERGREEYQRHDWAAAYASLLAADRAAALGVEDLDRLAWAAELSGDVEAFLKATERIYEVHLAEGASRAAAKAAFWVGFRAMSLGEAGRANAWLGRAQRLVEGESSECAEQGFLLLPVAFRHHLAGQLEAALAVAGEAAAIGDRVGDEDLSAFGRTIQGRALVRLGQIDRGMALLDESMLAATANRLSPVFTGLIYCTVIASCQRVYAIERAREWTAALSVWCESEPRAVAFQGPCLIHRAELLQIGGAWPEAIEEARHAHSRVRPGDRSARSDARYQEGEIHRLRGAYEEAERCFKEASAHGHEPQPGLALLRLGGGQREAAQSAIRRVVAETHDPLSEAKLLPAAIEIHLAVGDVASAREACARLDEIAARFATEVLGALAAHGRGRIHLAEGDAQAALGPLRRAFWVWQKVGAPYLAARVRVDLARACQALGDGEGARMELEVARAVFEELGAGPDVAALGTLPGAPAAKPPHGLTQRELQVLRLVAAGQTNKLIARQLFLSEKTIDRHVSNIFVKVNVGSRAAATAWAYEHHLV